MTLYYYEPTDEMIMIVDTRLGFVAEVVTHEHLDYLQSLYEKGEQYSFYDLVEMFPTAVPMIKNNLIRDIKQGIDVPANRVKLNFFNPHKKNGGITEEDILQAKSVPMSTFIKVPYGHKVQCLFHSDTKPSMHIYRNSFFCFACGAHGTTIDLVMKLQNKTFKEAVLSLVGKS